MRLVLVVFPAFATTAIHLVRNWLKVIRIHTRFYPAKMIERKAIWNRLLENFIHHAMRSVVFGLAIVARPYLTVALAIKARRPQPAT